MKRLEHTVAKYRELAASLALGAGYWVGGQECRLEEGMGELACKPAGLAISEAAGRVVNPGCQVRCLVCPPDEHPSDVGCEWEFALPTSASI